MSAHHFCLFLFGAATLSSTALAQGPGVEVQAGLGYAWHTRITYRFGGS